MKVANEMAKAEIDNYDFSRNELQDVNNITERVSSQSKIYAKMVKYV